MLKKYALPIALAALGVFLLVTNIKSCNDRKREVEEIRGMIQAYNDTTKYWRNKLDEEVASRKVVEGTLANVKAFFSKEDMSEVERRFDTKFDNIRSLVRISSQGTTTLPATSKPEIVYVDSSGPCPVITSMMQRFENPYYKLNVRVGDGAFARLTAFDTTTIVIKRDYKRRFLRKEWYTQVDAINANDSVRNTVQGAFAIKEGQPYRVFEVIARGGYRHFKANAGPSDFYGGLGGQFNLGRLSLTGSYNKVIGGSRGYFFEAAAQFSVLKL